MSDGDDRSHLTTARNHLLERVARADRTKMDKWLEPVTFDPGEVIYEPGQPMTHVILPETAMISLVKIMHDGRAAETAAIGCEGAAGLSASGFVDPSFARCIAQIPGAAFRVEAARFEDMVDLSPAFCTAVTRWRDVMIRTALQTVACNALHHARERCARWILTLHDRANGEPLPLTQDFLAGMLGVRRNAISKIARDLQALGMIAYAPGQITVVNRAALQGVACECYSSVRNEIDKLLNDATSPECDD